MRTTYNQAELRRLYFELNRGHISLEQFNQELRKLRNRPRPVHCLAKRMKHIGPVRERIIFILTVHGELTVQELAKELQTKTSTVERHLRHLLHMSRVARIGKGRWCRYRVVRRLQSV